MGEGNGGSGIGAPGFALGLALGVAAMAVVVTASNVLVQYPINDWLTWGAFTYPFAFLVTDLTNRRFGAGAARGVVWAGFACGVVLSALLAEPRIAAASGTAFLVAQLADVQVFDRLRDAKWWLAPSSRRPSARSSIPPSSSRSPSRGAGCRG